MNIRFSFNEVYEFVMQGLIIPEILRKMNRNYQKLPISLKFKLPKKFHDEVFGKDQQLIDGDLFQLIFSQCSKKTYHRGSYAILEQPVDVKYNKKKFTTILNFHYSVYNSFGVKQWPLK